jgi:hypothetical protein
MTTPWQNRIVGYRMIPVEEITANPRNFRVHPKHQQDALEATIDTTGYTVPVVNNVRTGYLLDGHLRVTLALRRGETHVPGIDVDLDPDKEALALATIDPIAALAATDREKMEDLRADIAAADLTLDAALRDLVGEPAGLRVDHERVFQADDAATEFGAPRDHDAIADRYLNSTVRQIFLIMDVARYEALMPRLAAAMEREGCQTTVDLVERLLDHYDAETERAA